MIKETLNKTDSVRKSCDQEYIPYFADLAVAKIAKQIESLESPTYVLFLVSFTLSIVYLLPSVKSLMDLVAFCIE